MSKYFQAKNSPVKYDFYLQSYCDEVGETFITYIMRGGPPGMQTPLSQSSSGKTLALWFVEKSTMFLEGISTVDIASFVL